MDYLFSDILQQSFPPDFRLWFPHDVRDAHDNLSKVTGESIQRYLARLNYVRAKLVEVIRGMSFAEFKRIRQLEAHDVSPEWVVCHLMQHEAEHREQIIILRNFFTDASAGWSNQR